LNSGEVVRRWIAAINEHDVTKLAAFYQEDAATQDIPLGEPRRGREKIVSNLSALLSAYPDFHIEITNIVESGDSVAIELLTNGTNLKPLRDAPPTGKAMSIREGMFIRLKEGKISKMTSYWDRREMTGDTSPSMAKRG